MDEKDFELLETLNKTHNITRAAEILFTTQSALSKRIVAIEAEMGNTTLMTRSRQGIRFTPEGEIVLEHVRRVTQELKSMREDLELSRSYVSGTLNVGVSINYARYNLPDVLVSFRREYPRVNLNIHTNQSRNLFLKIMNNEIDIAIIRGEYTWKESKILLSRENVYTITNTNDEGKNLSQIPYISHRTDSAFELELMQWLRENNLHETHGGLYVDNIETCVEMVKRGLGWAIVPEICLSDFDGVKQKLFFSDGREFTRSTWMLYSDTVSRLPQVDAFIRIIQTH